MCVWSSIALTDDPLHRHHRNLNDITMLLFIGWLVVFLFASSGYLVDARPPGQ